MTFPWNHTPSQIYAVPESRRRDNLPGGLPAPSAGAPSLLDRRYQWDMHMSDFLQRPVDDQTMTAMMLQ